MFHEMTLKLYFMKCLERKISQCILPLRISKMNVFAAAFEKQPYRNVFKRNSSAEAAIKMHFSISVFCTCGEILWKIPVMECNFSKFACNSLQLWTTAAEELYFITAFINAELQLLQNTSRKLLLSLEAVVRRCSSK